MMSLMQENLPLGYELPNTEEQLFALEKFPLLDFSEGMRTIGDKKILQELLQLMVDKSIPEDDALIQLAYKDKDWQRIENLAHKMKSGALYCGTIKMQYACQYLERYRKAGHNLLLDKLYHQLILVLKETKLHIENWLKNHPL